METQTVPPLPKAEKSESDTPKPILEYQEIAPSPSQTLYHISVYPATSTRQRTKSKRQSGQDQSLNRDRMKAGCIVLRDWPRKRMSQVWRRGGLVNPSEKIISFQDFCDGELNSQLITIFGQEKYNEILQLAKQELLK